MNFIINTMSDDSSLTASSQKLWTKQLSLYFWDWCCLLCKEQISYYGFLFRFLCDYQLKYDNKGMTFQNVYGMEQYFRLNNRMDTMLGWDLCKKYIMQNMSYVSTFEMTKIFFWWMGSKLFQTDHKNVLYFLFMPHNVRINLLAKYIDTLDKEKKNNYGIISELLEKRNTLHGSILLTGLNNMFDYVFLTPWRCTKEKINKIIDLKPISKRDDFDVLNNILLTFIPENTDLNLFRQNWTYQNAINIVKSNDSPVDNHILSHDSVKRRLVHYPGLVDDIKSQQLLKLRVVHIPGLIDDMVNSITFTTNKKKFPYNHTSEIINKFTNSSSTVNFSYFHFILRHTHECMFRFLF